MRFLHLIMFNTLGFGDFTADYICGGVLGDFFCHAMYDTLALGVFRTYYVQRGG